MHKKQALTAGPPTYGRVDPFFRTIHPKAASNSTLSRQQECDKKEGAAVVKKRICDVRQILLKCVMDEQASRRDHQT